MRSTRPGAVVVLAVLLTGAFAATAHGTVEVGGVPVRSRWFVLLALAVLCTVPLVERFGVLESSLALPRRCFATRLLVAGGPFALGVGACVVVVPGDDAVRWWFVLLVAVSIAVCAVASDAGWFVCLGVGGGSIMVDHFSNSLPVTNLVVQVGPVGSLITMGAAVVVYLRVSGSAPPRPTTPRP